MTKRIVSLLLAAMMMAMLIPSLAVAQDEWTMYVYTDNGGSLNVRRDPSTGDNIIGTLKYGDAVSVRMTMASGWTVIDWASGDGFVGYVQSRFLVGSKPAARGTTPSTPSSGTTAGGSLAAINKEFKAAQKVTVPFVVVARPSRASGWVNLRWAPSADAERITTCPQGKELLVLAQLKTWYQVQDPETGMIGFISMKYVTVR